MKIWRSSYIFEHPWDKVTEAAWKKYPNPMNPSVSAMDVVDRNITDGVLTTHRIVGCHWGLPSWVAAIVGSPRIMYGNENSLVDPGRQYMSLKTRNITLCNYIAVDEKLEYYKDPEDHNKTILHQEAVVMVEGVPLSNYLENLLTSTMSSNAAKGRQAMEWVISKINAEIKEFSSSVEKSKDQLLSQTRKSIDDLADSAKKSVDDISTKAKKSLDEFVTANPPPLPPMPDL